MKSIHRKKEKKKKDQWQKLHVKSDLCSSHLKKEAERCLLGHISVKQ